MHHCPICEMIEEFDPLTDLNLWVMVSPTYEEAVRYKSLMEEFK